MATLFSLTDQSGSQNLDSDCEWPGRGMFLPTIWDSFCGFFAKRNFEDHYICESDRPATNTLLYFHKTSRRYPQIDSFFHTNHYIMQIFSFDIQDILYQGDISQHSVWFYFYFCRPFQRQPLTDTGNTIKRLDYFEEAAKNNQKNQYRHSPSQSSSGLFQTRWGL